MKIFKVIAFVSLGLLLGLALNTGSSNKSKQVARYELANAFPPELQHIRINTSCVTANDTERSIFNTAVTALEHPDQEVSPLTIGALKLLSHGIFRNNGQVCDPLEVYKKAGITINISNHLRLGRITESGLKLISKLPNPNEQLTEIVANSAFNSVPQKSEVFSNRDIRPYSRSILAGLGERSKPYAQIAFEKISIKDSLGTGAAQVAAAADHPDALDRIVQLMNRKLSAFPKDKAIPRLDRDRLYEMAYALVYANSKSPEHLAPLLELMQRKVESVAPPFGIIELEPRRMCYVLAKLKQVGKKELNFEYCKDDGPFAR